MSTLYPRKLLAFGAGIGIEIRGKDLIILMAQVRPSGVDVLGSLVIPGFRERPAAEWGAEYARFARERGGSHVAATVILPKREVIVRQISLAGVASKDTEAALGFQIETLHPYGEDEATYGWARLTKQGAVLVGIVRRTTLTSYIEKFAEAGISVASFTFSATAIHGAARLYATPPEGFLATAVGDDGEIDIYGESAAHPVFSAQFDMPAQRAVALAISEMRLTPGAEPLHLIGILPTPKASPATLDLSAYAVAYAGALTGACPRLAPSANLLPSENRGANSRAMFVPTAVLAALLLLVGGAVVGYGAYEQKRFLAAIDQEVTRLQPQVKRAATADQTLANSLKRATLLDSFRGRSKADLDALNEITRLLVPPIWTNLLELSRDSLVIAGEAEQAAPLLKLIDSSPLFRDSTPAIPFVRSGPSELFRIKAQREGQ